MWTFQEGVSTPACPNRLAPVAAGQGLDELSEAHRVAAAPSSLADDVVQAPLVSEWAPRFRVNRGRRCWTGGGLDSKLE